MKCTQLGQEPQLRGQSESDLSYGRAAIRCEAREISRWLRHIASVGQMSGRAHRPAGMRELAPARMQA